MLLPQKTDTIAGIATGISRGGIGIVRVSGENLETLILSLFGQKLNARYATYVSIKDYNDDLIDQGIAIFFPSPYSFTGEDVLEFHGHGGVTVTNLVLQNFLHRGARLAEPGEFSKRAFLNGKVDLVQAESIADLIDATSKQAVKSANKSLSGVFSTLVNNVIREIKQIRILCESSIDFPEEDLPLENSPFFKNKLINVNNEIGCILKTTTQGVLLQQGANVVLVGEPNVGKSSLLNALAEDDIALVSTQPGTTRDINREEIRIKGVPFHIFDTAGIRESEDEVEILGIEKTKKFIQKADVLLCVCESGKAFSCATDQIFSLFPTNTPVIVVVNKIDLQDQKPQIELINDIVYVHLSAKTQDGVDLLKASLLKTIGWEQHENVYIARQRHVESLKLAKRGIEKSLSQTIEVELLAEELRLVQRHLCQITGEYTTNDLLGDIFSQFCIGK